MAQGFNDNLYLIDLSYLSTPAEVVYDLSSILDNEPAKNQRVKLKLGNVEFNKSQLLSIKSLIESINSTLAIVDGKSEITRNSAIAIGLVYQNSSDMVPETVFQDNKGNEDKQKPNIKEVKPELFPEVTPITQEVSASEGSQTDKTDDEKFDKGNNSFDNNLTKDENKSSETVEIAFPKTEHTENNKDIANSEEEELNYNSGFATNNWLKAENAQTNQQENTDITIRINSDEDTFELETQQNRNNVEENNKSNDSEREYIESLSLDIPSDETIQEELNVIYKTERKLEDVFENTGLKEEKFTSIKETAEAEEREYTQYDFEIEAFPTKYLKQTIFAGQFISFEGNLVIIGDCHEGSQIYASGDVTVWGNLSGSVHAGKNGNEKCKIRALHMNASQLKIANCFVKRPTALDTQTNTQTDTAPEEAKISKGEIVVYKIYK